MVNLHARFAAGKTFPPILFKDAGLLLFDANGDGKLDLYMQPVAVTKLRQMTPNTRTGCT
jgi:hypothetical protein